MTPLLHQVHTRPTPTTHLCFTLTTILDTKRYRQTLRYEAPRTAKAAAAATTGTATSTPTPFLLHQALPPASSGPTRRQASLSINVSEQHRLVIMAQEVSSLSITRRRATAARTRLCWNGKLESRATVPTDFLTFSTGEFSAHAPSADTLIDADLGRSIRSAH